MTDTAARPAAERRDLWIIGGIALLLLGVLTPFTGIWEPWEADRASAVEHLRTAGQWLAVEVPGTGDPRSVAELPYGWWPLMASTALLGINELGLRLPGVALGLLAVLLTFATTRRLFGRVAGYAAGLGLMMMPLFAFHSRLALGPGVEAGLVAIAGLAFVRAAADADASARWAPLGWVFTLFAGLVGGAPALLATALTGVAATLVARGQGRSPWTVARPLWVAVAVLGVAGGWALAVANRGDGVSVAALLAWADPLDAADPSKRPFFHQITHQLGFGLFPLAAFIPLAFADLLWHRRLDDEPTGAAVGGPILLAWFAAGVLAPAIVHGFGQASFIVAAPAAAMAVGAYFARVLRSPPQPLLAVTAVILLALLDSNLKHDTHALADMLVGAPVGAFPAKLPLWSVSRGLDMALLAMLLLYQGGMAPWLQKAARWVVYPDRPIRLFAIEPSRSWLSLLAAVAVAAPILLRKPDWFDRLLAQRFWGRTLPGARLAICAIAIIVVAHLLVWAVWNWRRRMLDGRSTGAVDRFVGDVFAGLDTPGRRVALFGVVLLGWTLFTNGVAARAMTTNFSQKDLIGAYESAAADGEPLFTYRMDAKSSSFYARDLEALKSADFASKAKADARFFALIPRKQLATINGAFRRATGRTLPVLDDRSERTLLVSNQLRDGDADHNPIKRAIVDKLPPGATRVDHVWEDDIALAGWMLEPKEPRPGAPLKIHLFWKPLKKVRHNWKVFVHIDAPGQRIHGDHDPVEGLYPSSNWTPGDIVHDVHRVNVKRTTQSNRYTFYTGLFRGSTRKKISKGNKDKENRANLGRVRVR